ncbi:hypothetical protein LWI29_006250 [Acer saccharum]|uniref:Uncharacterized protein n=1 Tax=Acer saccharum TaxID=4024 RepID=A0AA39RCK3_ACESA|nr:hypothetical protein LWI29_006250 [Acer saccharum]
MPMATATATTTRTTTTRTTTTWCFSFLSLFLIVILIVFLFSSPASTQLSQLRFNKTIAASKAYRMAATEVSSSSSSVCGDDCINHSILSIPPRQATQLSLPLLPPLSTFSPSAIALRWGRWGSVSGFVIFRVSVWLVRK